VDYKLKPGADWPTKIRRFFINLSNHPQGPSSRLSTGLHLPHSIEPRGRNTETGFEADRPIAIERKLEEMEELEFPSVLPWMELPGEVS
jgi:hypothetical protein